MFTIYSYKTNNINSLEIRGEYENVHEARNNFLKIVDTENPYRVDIRDRLGWVMYTYQHTYTYNPPTKK